MGSQELNVLFLSGWRDAQREREKERDDYKLLST